MLEWDAKALQATCIASVPPMLIVKFISDITRRVYWSLILQALVYSIA